MKSSLIAVVPLLLVLIPMSLPSLSTLLTRLVLSLRLVLLLLAGMNVCFVAKILNGWV